MKRTRVESTEPESHSEASPHGLSAEHELLLLVSVSLGATALLALLVVVQVKTGATRAAAVTILLLAAGFGKTFAQRSLRRMQRISAELKELREQRQASEAASKVKRGRGRRDAFNEILLGLEARAEEVQRDRDNLEQLVNERTLALKQRNEAMRLVLDNVEQGLATIELDGTLSPERSRAFDEWFGAAPASATSFAEQLCAGDARMRETLRMAWEQLSDGIFPIELSLEQMPNRLARSGRHYQLDYRPIFDAEALQGVLLVVSDVTDQLERVRRDVEQREVIAVFERVMRDRSGALEFIDECDSLVKQATDPAVDHPQRMRLIHTIKGNCALFDISSVAEVAHRIEDSVVERQAPPTATELGALAIAWRTLSDRLHRLLGNGHEPGVEMSQTEYEQLLRATSRRAPHAEIHARIERLRYERVVPRLQRTAEQARDLARRLGKGELDIEIIAESDLRLSAERWAPFWSAFVHVVRNAIDHGIEPAQERALSGKPTSGKLRIAAWTDERGDFIELADDGRGVDWDRVRDRANERGLPHANQRDLVNALFADGFSTAKSVSEISGRGVGLGAVKEATLALGGTVEVQSAAGRGTTLTFVFPAPHAPVSAGDLRQSA